MYDFNGKKRWPKTLWLNVEISGHNIAYARLGFNVAEPIESVDTAGKIVNGNPC